MLLTEMPVSSRVSRAAHASGVSPKSLAVIRKSLRHCARHARNRLHQGSAGSLIQITHIVEMLFRNYQHMTGMKLAKIDKCHRRFILRNNAGWQRASRNLAKRASN